MEHPSDEQLQRFARLTSSRVENRSIIVHLLQGCPRCGAKIRAGIDPPIPEEAYNRPLDNCERACRTLGRQIPGPRAHRLLMEG